MFKMGDKQRRRVVNTNPPSHAASLRGPLTCLCFAEAVRRVNGVLPQVPAFVGKGQSLVAVAHTLESSTRRFSSSYIYCDHRSPVEDWVVERRALRGQRFLATNELHPAPQRHYSSSKLSIEVILNFEEISTRSNLHPLANARRYFQ